MSHEMELSDSMNDKEKYEALLTQMDSIVDASDFEITTLSNFTAVLKEAFPKISWVGFYLRKDDSLYLGPFQGRQACTRIKIGKGVCGSAAAGKKTVIVKDVDEFPGHIACDSSSRSEIVVPIIRGDDVVAVLDIDSPQYGSFTETDKIYLEKLCRLLSGICEFSLL